MAKNMRMDKNAMPEQPAEVHNKNFLEVALGYTAEQAMDEARRCLSCRNRPCVSGCPVGVDIPGFIAKVAEGFEPGYQPACHLRPRVPAGNPVRGEMRTRPQRRKRRDRPAGALRGGLENGAG